MFAKSSGLLARLLFHCFCFYFCSYCCINHFCSILRISNLILSEFTSFNEMPSIKLNCCILVSVRNSKEAINFTIKTLARKMLQRQPKRKETEIDVNTAKKGKFLQFARQANKVFHCCLALCLIVKFSDLYGNIVKLLMASKNGKQ